MKISDIPARAKVVEDNVDRSNGNKIWITNPNYLPLDSTAGFPEELFGEMSAENSVDIADNYYRIMIDQEGRQAIFEPVDNHYQIESILGVGEKAFGEALHFQVKFSDRIAKFTSKVLNRFSQKNDNGAKVKVTNHFITEPKKKLDTAILSLIYSLNDGQKITIVMFAPDSTPNKIKPTDVFVAYRFLLNQKDITNVVAPQKGKDIPIEKVAKVVMGLAAKNSAKFEKRNNEKTEAENLIKKSTKQIQKQEDYASSLLFFNKLLNNISRIFEEVSKNHPDNEGLPNIKTDFTPEQLLAEYKDNEHYNNHVENNLMLAKAFGSPDEVKKLEEIIEKRERTGGGIEEEDWQWIKNNLIKKNSAIYDKLEKEVARNQAEQLAEKISLKNAGKELDKETERNYLLAESEASFKQANAMIEELKEILAEDNEVNAGQEEIYHHITEKLAGYYSAEDEELKAKAKEIEVLLDDVGEKINTTKNLASQTRIPQEKKHVLSVAEQLGEIDEEILKQQGLLMGESEEELGVDKESESISPAGSLQAEVEDFGEAGSNEESLKKWNGVKKIVKNQGEEFIMFEQGQFYEVYEENAEKLSMLLNIQTTKRSGLLMAGFGVFTASKYIDKLKKKGIDPKIKTYDKDKKAWVDKKGNVNKTSYGELENAEAEGFGEGAKKVTLATLKAHARKDNLLYRVSDELGDTVGFVDPYKKYSKTFKEAKLSYFEYEKRGNPFMLFSNPYIKLEPDGEVTLNTDTHIVELKLKEGKFGEEESFEELGEMARDSRVSKAKLRGDYTDEKIRVGSLWHSLKKDPFTGKKIVVKLTGNKYGRVQFVIKGTDMRSDETKELFFSLYAPNKSYGEEESFEENTTEGLSDNNTVFLGTDNGCLGTDNGNSFIGETENAEVETIGEGETLHTDNLEAEIKAEIESEIEAQDFGENGEISNFGEMSFKKTKTIKKDGITFKTDYKDWDKVDELPASFEIHSPDLKGVHIEAKRIEMRGGGLSNTFEVALLKGNKTIYTNKDKLFAGLPSAEARGRLFLKKYKKEMAKDMGEGEVTKDFGENATYREITTVMESNHSSEYNKIIVELVKDYEDKKYNKIKATKMWLKLARTVKNKYRRENSRLYKEYGIEYYDNNDLAEDWEEHYHTLMVDGAFSSS